MLLEREPQNHALQAALQDAVRNHGRILLVSGEAGIGKTSLVASFTDQNRMKADVYWGACDPLLTPRPLGPLYDIALHGFPDLQHALDEKADWLSISTLILKALRALPTPAVMVFEDIHWADEATLDLLRYLGRRIQPIHLLLILTYRDDEPESHHLQAVLGHFPAACIDHIPLGPLSKAAVEIMVGETGRDAADVYTVTQGNPFFISEVLKSAGEIVPATIRDAVLTRTAFLSREAREILELASIVPGGIRPHLIEAILGPNTAALDTCIAAHFLLPTGNGLVFRHELARIAIERSLSYGHSRDLHRKVLNFFLAADPPRAPFAQLVHYAFRAEEGKAILRFAPLAAREASQQGAHREAARQYQIALSYKSQIDPLQQAELLEGLSFEYYLTGRMQQAIQSRLEANQLWSQAHGPLREGDGLRWLSRLNWFLGRQAEAERYADAAVEVLENQPAGPELAMAYSNRSQLFMLSDLSGAAIDWGEKALALAEKVGDAETSIHALTNIGTAELMMGNLAGQGKLEWALKQAKAREMHDHVARCYANLSTEAVRLREYQLSRRYLDEGIAYTTERDMDSYSIYLHGWRARWNFEQGFWTEAAEEAEQALAFQTESAVMPLPALITLGHLRARQGHLAARDLLDRAQTLALPTGEIQRIGPMSAARAEMAWWQGNQVQATVEAQTGYDLALPGRDPWILGMLAYWLWRTGAIDSPPPSIPEAFMQMMTGNWQAAASAWEGLHCPFERALALSDGDRDARLQALEIFDALGARPAAAWLRNLLRRQGAKDIPRGPRASTRVNPQGLTAREMEVLGLIAEGKSNAEIAARLSIAVKTVDHHVTAVLAKLGVHSRSEAAAVLHKLKSSVPK